MQLPWSLLGLSVAILGWFSAHCLGRQRTALVLLLAACTASGAAWHHYRRDVFRPDDIGSFAMAIPQPVQLRGVLEEEPQRTPARPATPLHSLENPESTSTVLRVAHLRQRADWLAVSGRVRLVSAGPLPPLHVGDAIETTGGLSTVEGPANPGGFDHAGFLRDQGIQALLVVRKTPDGVTRLERGWPTSFTGCLMAVRGWGQEVLGDVAAANRRAAWHGIIAWRRRRR